MAKFKVGDRVRALVNYDDVRKGSEYTISSVDGDGDYYIGDDLMFERELELIPAATVIIIGEKGAATFPFKHPNKAAAIAEADRLAVKFPGQKFEVYELVSTRRGSVSVGEV